MSAMDDIVNLARAAKSRLKNNYWADCKKSIDENTTEAKLKGISERKVKSTLSERVKNEIKGEKRDEFYLKVKRLLDEEGEVSEAIGRLTDEDFYATLSYEEKQRYLLDLSNKYLSALTRYRKEKELGL